MPSTLTVIREATDRVQAADDVLEELTALVELNRLVKSATQHAIASALLAYTDAEVAEAIGSTKQWTNRLRRQKNLSKGTFHVQD